MSWADLFKTKFDPESDGTTVVVPAHAKEMAEAILKEKLDHFTFATDDGLMSLDMASMRDVGPCDFEKEHMVDAARFGTPVYGPASTTGAARSATPFTADSLKAAVDAVKATGMGARMGTLFSENSMVDALLTTASDTLQPSAPTVEPVQRVTDPRFGSW